METINTIVVGILTGFSAGMFGIGGALISTPLLRELVHLPEYTALATPLPATLPAAISGSFIYLRERLLRPEIAGWVLLTGIPANVVGVRLVNYVSGPVLMILTGLMLAYSAVIFLQRSRESKAREKAGLEEEPERTGRGVLLATGLLAGFMSGFLAIGGGIVMVPAFVRILRIPTKQALATSLFCVAALAIPGVIGHTINGFIDWRVALILCVTVFPLSALGAKTATRTRSARLEFIYGFAMLVFAIFFIIKNL